jgi:hypothetical protein
VDLPIICTLSESELQERRRTVLGFIRGAVREVTPLPLGYAFAFRPTAEILERVAHLVNMERQCCQFLTFKIIVEAAGGPIRLEVTGPTEDARAVIGQFLGVTPHQEIRS